MRQPVEHRDRPLNGYDVDRDSGQDDTQTHNHRYCGHVARRDDQESADHQEDDGECQVYLQIEISSVQRDQCFRDGSPSPELASSDLAASSSDK